MNEAKVRKERAVLRGREFEKRWAKLLREVEVRAYPTVASGATFGDHDVKSSAHISQCKSTDEPKKSVSINLKEFGSLVQCADRQWRDDGIGKKVPLYVNQLCNGYIMVTLPSSDYLDILRELADLREEIKGLKAIEENLYDVIGDA